MGTILYGMICCILWWHPRLSISYIHAVFQRDIECSPKLCVFVQGMGGCPEFIACPREADGRSVSGGELWGNPHDAQWAVDEGEDPRQRTCGDAVDE